MARFHNRRDAGRSLARALRGELGANVLVLGLARGGVPVAYEVARSLQAPLDVLVARKLGVPGHEELAMGAIGPGGQRVLNEDVIRLLHIPPSTVESVAEREQEEASRRAQVYRRGRSSIDVRGRHVVAVDDGLATGASMRVAVASLRALGASQITVAVPTGSPEACDELCEKADAVLCLTSPEQFLAVGQSYEDFSPTTDREVQELLARAAEEAEEQESASQTAHD
jgi:putative phosphoribosyl transferase